MTKIEKTVAFYYKSDDGREFEDELDCEIWEKYFPKTVKEVLAPYIRVVPNDQEGFREDGITWRDGFVIVNQRIPWEIDKYVSLLEQWDIEENCQKKGYYGQQFVNSYVYMNCEQFPTLFEYLQGDNKWQNRGAKWQIEDILEKNTRYLKMWEE